MLSQGPDTLNIQMRVKALEKNMSLNEYGLVKVDPDTKARVFPRFVI